MSLPIEKTAVGLALLTLVLCAPPRLHAAPALPMPRPYLKNCDGFLAALGEAAVEDFFLDQASTPGERLQLLLDYRVVFSEQFDRALRAAPPLVGFEQWSNRELVRTLADLRADSTAMAGLADHVLDHLANSAASEPFDAATLVNARRTRQFVEALRHRADAARFGDIVIAAIDNVFGLTIEVSRGSTLLAIRTSRPYAYGMMGGVMGSFLLGVISIGIPPFGFGGLEIGMASSMGFGLTGVATIPREPRDAIHRDATLRASFSLKSGGVQLISTALRNEDSALENSDLALPRAGAFDVASIASRTPVELTYLGLVDEVELTLAPIPSLVTALRAAWLGTARLTEAAERLARGDESVSAQLDFATSVNAVGEPALAAIRAFEDELETRRRKLADLARTIDDLEQMCFAKMPDSSSATEGLYRQLVICRSRHDRHRLAEVIVTGGFEGEIAELARPLVGALLETVRGRPRTADDWRSAAARAIDLTGDLRRLIAER